MAATRKPPERRTTHGMKWRQRLRSRRLERAREAREQRFSDVPFTRRPASPPQEWHRPDLRSTVGPFRRMLGRGYEEGTARTYLGVVRNFLRWLGNRPIRPATLEEYGQHLQGTRSPCYRWTAAAALRCWFAWLELQEHARHLPAVPSFGAARPHTRRFLIVDPYAGEEVARIAVDAAGQVRRL